MGGAHPQDRTETAHPVVARIVAGHFHERARYATWREHGTQDWLLVCTLGGRGRFGWEGGEIAVTPGDIALLRPGVRHDYGLEGSERRWELLWAHFHPLAHWLEWLDWPEEAPGLMRLRVDDRGVWGRVTGRLADASRLSSGAMRRAEELAMNALEEALLWCDTVNPRSGEARVDARLRAAMDYLCRNLGEPVPMNELARVCGLSVSRISHLFQQQAGVSAQQYLEQQRIARARQLLELTARPVGQIAHEVGFANPFYFSLRFKRHTGMSPTEYRRRATR